MDSNVMNIRSSRREKKFNEEAETPRGVQQVGKEPEVSFACHEYSIGCHD